MQLKRQMNQQGYQFWLYLLLINALLYSFPVFAQFELPGTDLWRIPLQQTKHGLYQVDTSSNATLLTPYAGYDNQPSFSNDGQWLFFTRGNQSGYTDIFQLNLVDPQAHPTEVNPTPLSEFSPQWQVWRGKPALLMVQVQANGEQWLVAMDLSSKKISRINDADTVGYFAPVEDGIFQFIVSDPIHAEFRPNDGSNPSKIAEHIGRGVLAIPSPRPNSGSNKVLYTQLADNNTLLIEWNAKSGAKRQLTFIPEAVQDFALDQSGAIWIGMGSKLYRWHSEVPKWTLMADLRSWGIHGITRLSIHQSTLVLVANENHM